MLVDHTVQVDLIGIEAFGFEENLVPRLIGNLTILSSMDGQ